MNSKLANLALTATLALAITLTLSCGNHTFEELLGLESSSSQQEDYSSSSSLAKLSSSSSLQQSSSSRLGSSSSSNGGSVQSGVVYGDPVTYGGETYKTVVIGTQTWFQRNLNYDIEGSKCYDNDPANCQKYGRLYNWEMAMEACPSGWHLPSSAEWGTLTDFAGGRSVAGGKLKTVSGWLLDDGTDIYGFSALPGGEGKDKDTSFSFVSVSRYGFFWSSTEWWGTGSKSSQAYQYRIDAASDYVMNTNVGKSSLHSVRCLKGYSSSSSSKPSSSSSSSSFISPCSISGHKTVKIGNQTWMAENLNCEVEGSKCYKNDPANCTKWGRLYNYSTANVVCPIGWHLPSDTEWKTLINSVGLQHTTEKLMSKTGWRYGGGTDYYGFSALPGRSEGGSCVIVNIRETDDYAFWWTSENAYAYSIRFSTLFRDQVFGEIGCEPHLSVRCVQNSDGKDNSSSSSLKSSGSAFPSKGNDMANYKTVKIGEQTWMAENLNYAIEGSQCYGEGTEIYNEKTSRYELKFSNSEIQANCEKYGRLYNTEAAKKACPIGWHLPSENEWETLRDFVGRYPGEKLKTTSGWIDRSGKSDKSGDGTDEYGFSALPGGECDVSGDCSNIGERGSWWTTYPSYIEIYGSSAGVSGPWSGGVYGDLHSIRCVKD